MSIDQVYSRFVKIFSMIAGGDFMLLNTPIISPFSSIDIWNDTRWMFLSLKKIKDPHAHDMYNAFFIVV